MRKSRLWRVIKDFAGCGWLKVTRQTAAHIVRYFLKRLIRQDMKRLGAMADMEKKEMPHIIADLLREQAITVDDLSDFSDELKETVEYLMRG